MTTIYDECCIVCDSYNIIMTFDKEGTALYNCRDCHMEWDEWTSDVDDFWSTTKVEQDLMEIMEDDEYADSGS